MEEEQQNASKGNGEKASRKKGRLQRHLDHLADLTEGVHYTACPEPLRTAWFDKKITDSKCRFIMMMIGNSANFQLKQSYLRARFHSNTIAKYTRELIEDGVIRLEKVRIGAGKEPNVHHVNPISKWRLRELQDDLSHSRIRKASVKLNGSPVNGSPVNGSPVNGSPVSVLNQNKKTKPNYSEELEPKKGNQAPLCGGGGKPQPSMHSSLIQFTQDHFDPVFAIKGRTREDTSLGFDYRAANEAVANVVERIGARSAAEFALWLRNLKAETGRIRIAPKELPTLLARYQAEPDTLQHSAGI